MSIAIPLWIEAGGITRTASDDDLAVNSIIPQSATALSIGAATATSVIVGDTTFDLSGGFDLTSTGAMSIGDSTATSLNIGGGVTDGTISIGDGVTTGKIALDDVKVTGAAIDKNTAGALSIGTTTATSVIVDGITFTGVAMDGTGTITIGASTATAVTIDALTVTGVAVDGSGDITIGASTADSVQIDTVKVTGNVVDTAATGTLSLGTATATAVTIGSATADVTVDGDFYVTGDENVTGATTFDGDVTLGDASGDTIVFTGSVDSDINFVGPQQLTTSTGDMKLVPEGTTVAQGGLGVALTGTLEVEAASATVVSSADLTSEVNVGDAVEIVSSGGTEIFTVITAVTAGGFTIDSNSTYTDVAATGSVDDNLFQVQTGDVAARLVQSKSGGLTVTYGEADGAVMTLANDQDAINTQMFVTPDEPPTMAAANGDIAMTTTTGKLYFYGAAAWNEAGTSTPTSLQGAYDQQGASPVQLLTNDWEIQIDDNAANWIVTDEAGTSGYIATNYTNNSIDLGSSAGKEVHFLGNVGTNLAFDGTADRTITNAETMTVSTTGVKLLSLTGGGGITNTSTGGAYTVTATGQTVAIDGAGVSIDGTAASNVTVTANDLTLSTLTSGNVNITAADDINLLATGSDIDMDAATLTVDMTGAISLDSVGTSNWTNSTGNLTISTTTSGTLAVTGVAALDMDGTVVTLDGSTSVAIDSAGTTLLDSATGTTVSADAGGVTIDATAGNIALTAPAASDVNITATSDAASDINFAAHGLTIPFNATTSTALNTTAQDVIGALNELKAAEADISVAVTTGEAYAIGDAICLKVSDGKAYKCDSATATETTFIGVAKDASTGADESKSVIAGGEVTSSTDFAAMANGDTLYLTTVVGSLSDSAPASGTILKVGVVTDIATDKFLIQVGAKVTL